MQTTAMILVFVYFGGIIGALSTFSATVWVLGSLLFVYEVLFRKFITINFQRLIPYFIFITLSVTYFYFFRERYLFFWDEFSHWGVVIKEMKFTNQIYGRETNAVAPHYFPGTALWQYTVTFLSDYNESSIYFSQFLFLIIPLLIFFEKINIQRIYWIFPIGIIILFSIYNFGHGLASLYVDHIVGVWFAGILTVNFYNSKNIYFNLGNIFVLSVLLLIKDVGGLFILFGIAVFILHRYQNFREKKKIVKFLKKNMIIPVLTCALVIVILGTWSWNRKNNGVESSRHSGLSIAKELIFREQSQDLEKIERQANKFLEIVVSQQISKDEVSWRYNEFSFGIMKHFTGDKKITTFYFLISLFVWSIALFKITDKKKYSIFILLLILFCAMYLIVLFQSYLFAFGREDYPSFIRYFHSIVLPVVLVSIFILTPAISNRKNKKKDAINVTILFAIIIGFLFFEKPYLEPIYNGNKLSSFRKNIEPIIAELKLKVQEGKKVWVYFPVRENGFMRTMLNYEIAPIKSDIIHQENIFIDRLESIIKTWGEYNYIWFPVRSPSEEKGLSNLFLKSPNARLFMVNQDGQNFSLQPL